MEWLLVSWPTLIILGLGVRMALRLTYGARGPEPGDPVHLFLSIYSWVLIALGVAPAILGGLVSVFGFIILLLAISTIFEAILQSRAAQRRSMSRMLALLVERGAQLETSVLLAGQTFRGIVGRASRRLFATLAGGTPLSAAVAKHPGALPREAAAFLAAGDSADARFAALRELGRGEQDDLSVVWRATVDRLLYLAAVLMFLGIVLIYVLIKVVPEYAKIFNEFDMPMPGATSLLVSSSNFVVEYLAVPLLLAFTATAVAAFVIGVCYLCDWPVLKPILDRLFRGRQTARVLRIIALATEHRQPLADVLRRLAGLFPSSAMRRRLAPAAAAVEAGADWPEVLMNVGIIGRAEHSLLHTAESVGNLPWALREIAMRREKRGVYRLAAALQVLYPLAILVVGACIGFYAVALFLPIAKLVEGLS